MSSLLASLRSSSSSLPPIRSIITRTKNETVRRHLQNCHLIAGIHCNGLTVKHLQNLRGALPNYTKLLIARNTLVQKSIEGTRWESLKFCARGMNAWLFVHDDENIPGALKPYRDFQREWGIGLNDFTGAVFEGKLYGPDEFEVLETMPTRFEVYNYLLGCFQTPAASLIGILQAKEMDLAGGLHGNVKEVEEDGGAVVQ